jgi:hypothetical protein
MEKSVMKKLITICLVCVLTAAASQGQVLPTTTTNISFDENGNGIWSDSQGGSGTLGYGSFGDEIGIYSLTPPNQSTIGYGAVLIYEDDAQTILSDYLLFGSDTNPTNDSISSFVYFYSDIEGTVLQAPGGYTNVVSLTEEGDEDGQNGVSYTPGVNDPGYMAQYGERGVTYTFVSDGTIPEPATICMLGFGVLSLIRRKKLA